jgi:hypothetical protein
MDIKVRHRFAVLRQTKPAGWLLFFGPGNEKFNQRILIQPVAVGKNLGDLGTGHRL